MQMIFEQKKAAASKHENRDVKQDRKTWNLSCACIKRGKLELINVKAEPETDHVVKPTKYASQGRLVGLGNIT